MPKVTEKYYEQLIELGVETPIKALYTFPKNLVFVEKSTYEPELTEGVFAGMVTSVPSTFRTGRSIFVRFSFETNGHTLPIICFNQQYLTKLLTVGMSVVLHVKQAKRNWVAAKVYYKDLDSIGLESKYTLLKGMQQARYKKYVQACFEALPVAGFLPEDLHQKYKIISRKDAFTWMHFPPSLEHRAQAVRYFKYEEAFLFQLNLQIRKAGFKKNDKKIVKQIDVTVLPEIIAELPFALTGAQVRVLEEITRDFKGTEVMHRLVQGDVGSGKTVVAMLAALLQIRAGYQVAILAPTTILAEQHFESMQKFLEHHKIVIGFLRSQMKKKEREEILRALAHGDIHLIVGTHALLEPDVVFKNLGLAVVDEQQRFGVEQRKKLRNKNDAVDMLYMTATPIPRTMAMSVFGDLDVSTIDELPAGRQEIDTRVVKKRYWENVVTKIIETVAQREQVYVVVPLIAESETMDVANIEDIYAQLKRELPPNIRLGMLHGKQTNEEKQTTIAEFSAETIDVLVSTTVVEVGVHVERATLMVIMDAQQFGLSQLHQLRGRIGRSDLAATCLLVSDAKTERLKIMEQSQDGFYLSQEDLKLRGPGDFFGEKQSGVPTFQLLNIVEDFPVLDCARVDVEHILEDEEQLATLDKITAYITRKKAEITEYLA